MLANHSFTDMSVSALSTWASKIGEIGPRWSVILISVARVCLQDALSHDEGGAGSEKTERANTRLLVLGQGSRKPVWPPA